MAVAAAGAWLLSVACRRLSGTTLVGPCRWAIGSLVCLAVVQALLDAAPVFGIAPAWLAYLQYLAGTATLAPFVALLGAKRPQDRAWQWIVFSLLVVVALPGAAAALRGGGPGWLHPAWKGFICLLLAAQTLNFLPTRFAVASLLFLLAQACLLSQPLFGRTLAPYWQPRAGLIFTVAAVGLAWCLALLPRRASGVERLWLDFRDMFGVLWSLRVAERFNASARHWGWPVHLRWNGLELPAAGCRGTCGDTSGIAADIERHLRGLLLRFVAADWISSRLAAGSLSLERPDC